MAANAFQTGFKPAFGVKQRKDTRALETPGSNLQKFLDFVGRVGAGERQALINVVKAPTHEKIGAVLNPMGSKPVLSGMIAGLTGEAKPSGYETISAIRGKEPTTKTGKVVQTVTGITADVLNPGDPINKLKILGILKGVKPGTALPAVEGLIKGERSLVSLGPLHTPGFVNKVAGEFFRGAGKAVMEFPGMKTVAKAFTPALQKLRPLAAAKNWLAERQSMRDIAKSKALETKFKDLVKKLEVDPAKYIPAPMLTRYKAMGMDVGRMAMNEMRRSGELGKLAGQGRLIASLKHEKKLAKMAGDKQQMRVLDDLKAVIKESRPSLASAVHPSLKELAEPIQRLGEKYGARGQRFGFLGDLQEDFMGRSLTPEARELTMKESFGTGGGTFKKGYEFNKKRILPELTAEQMEATFKVPHLMETIYGGSFLNKPIQQSKLGAMLSKQKGAPRFFNEDVFAEINKRIIGTNKASSNAMAIKSFVNTPDFAKPTVKDWGNVPSKMVDIPEQFQKFVGVKSVAVPEEIIPEFNHFTQAITSPKELSKFLKNFDAFNSAFKTTTLYMPTHVFQTLNRNILSDSWMSWFRGAVSGQGLKDAITLEMVFKNQAKALENGTWVQELNKLPNELRVYAKFIDKSGRINTHSVYDALRGETDNAVTKILKSGPITGWGLKLNESASRFTRFQHFMTRIHQGWTPKAAMDDTLATLYDYRYGLSDFENQVLRRVFPFYAWMRFNIPAMLENVMKQPGRALVVDRIKKNWEATGDKPDERALAEYVKGDLGINVGFDKSTQRGTRLRLKGVLPLADIEDVSSPRKFGDLLLASANPLLKGAFEEASGQSAFFKTAGGDRARIEEYPGQTGKFLGMDIPRKNINRLRQVRALNEINKLMGAVKGGAPGAPQLSPTQFGLRSTGASLVPFDVASDLDRARSVYKSKLHALKSGMTRQKKYGRSTDEVEEKMKELMQRAF